MSKYNYNDISPGYYDSVYHRNSGVQSRWHHHKFETISRFMPLEGRHLDIGCGPGTFIGTLLSSSKIKSYGIDFSHQQIEYASSHYESERSFFNCIDLFDPLFTEKVGENFDVITFIEVIEHIERNHAIKMLSSAKAMLKKSGTLIVTTPNYHSAWGLLEKVVNQVAEVTYEEQHINRYSSSRLRDDLYLAGFSEVKVSSFLSASPFIASANWDASKKLSRNEIYRGIFRPLGFLLIAIARA